MSKFKADPTDPVASAKGWTRRRRRAEELDRLWERVKKAEARVEELERNFEPVHRPGENWWSCLIGPVEASSLRGGSDAPMRKGVEDAFFALAGSEAHFCSSGWGAAPTRLMRDEVIGGGDERP
jgi:hypothetical protein